ncbi:hypothetical protein [Streptomyces sp. NPDC058614]|uniref:hypothetical protein n=1 Tax=Streptomyces sp. NPDC058614 TaxID=3346557 RepID=UPI0036671D83
MTLPQRRHHRSANPTRDKVLLYTLTPLGLFLFALGAIGGQIGLTVLPFDPHHAIAQVGGLGLALAGLTHWK